jgi:hypothetical protein
MDTLFESVREITEQAELYKAQLQRLHGLYPVLYVGEQDKPATRRDYLTRVENNAEEGVKKHGGEWLTASERAIEVAVHYNLILQILNKK